MKVYTVKGETQWDPATTTAWQLYNGTIEECLRQHAGKKTIQLVWEDDSILKSVILASFQDLENISDRLGDKVIKKMKEQFR